MTKTLEIKLASIAVHVEEMTSNPHKCAVEYPATVDLAAIVGLLGDPEVRAYLDDKNNAVYLPVKRSTPAVVTKKKR